MIRLVLSGLWVCFVTLAASYAAANFKVGGRAPAAADQLKGVQVQTTPTITVPMIKNGAVQGYVVAQFAFTIEAATRKRLSVPPQVFLSDAAFRTIYSDPSLDFRHLQKYDINKLTRSLIRQTNRKLKGQVIKDILVREFNFVSKEDARE